MSDADVVTVPYLVPTFAMLGPPDSPGGPEVTSDVLLSKKVYVSPSTNIALLSCKGPCVASTRRRLRSGRWQIALSLTIPHAQGRQRHGQLLCLDSQSLAVECFSPAVALPSATTLL